MEDEVCYITKNEAIDVFTDDCKHYPNKHFRTDPDIDPMERYWPLYKEKEELKAQGLYK